MKYRGRKISGASLLSILGVVCFTTILVAAAIVFTSATWTNNVPSAAGVVTKQATGSGANLPQIPAIGQNYTFRLHVAPNVDTTTGSVTVTIAKTSIAETDVTLKYGGATLVPTVSSGVLTFTMTGSGSLAWTHGVTTYDYDFELTYHVDGDYSCTGGATA